MLFHVVKVEIVIYFYIAKLQNNYVEFSLTLKGISWIMPGKITEALKSWEEAGSMAKNRSRWRIIPACIPTIGKGFGGGGGELKLFLKYRELYAKYWIELSFALMILVLADILRC